MAKITNLNFLFPPDTNGKTNIWFTLIGNPNQFSLERRVFHSVSIGLIALALIYAPYNLFAGLYVGSVSALGISLFIFQQYYYSRFKDKPHNNTLFGLMGLLAFGINYFAIAGINGSTDIIWPAYLLVLLVISPYEQHLKWLAIYLLWFFAIHTLGYYYPELIKYPFATVQGQFIDRMTAFPLPVFVIYIIVRFIRRSYDLERMDAQRKAVAIESSKEEILRQKEELEQRSLEKDNLMSIISHDVRAPLVNIQSYLSLLNKNVLNVEDQRSIQQSLESATNHTITMLSNLLNWSKSQMGGSVVQLEAINVLQVLESTIEMGTVFATKKGITFSNTIPSHLRVVADVDMLQIVVRNLINNAVKFTPNGGTISIAAEVVYNACEITITDNGRGIAPSDQANIFSIKAGATYGTNNEKGVGLGLVLCKEFIERMGGKIGFESIVNEGSKFFISLPLAE
ncbi:sensor histidine kinase [Pedobacter yonginense]|uniref:histidine kinase n=1 Tax=Pedobacter yonginense TaxID=651869 RepID=A0A317ERQ2_9SPHI|nr:HAMP domain-containing sensor histidine kinase [Pedobacter yonginense]PWS28777.1 sensor histidine kinase [Pedobacter yonginense]